MGQPIYLTKEGYTKLKAELEHLKSKGRREISAAIAEARDKGDLSENAEYDAAKEAQGMLEMRIAKLEDALAGARVIDESQLDNSKVLVLSKVKIKNQTNGHPNKKPYPTNRWYLNHQIHTAHGAYHRNDRVFANKTKNCNND